jgi:hypothetical protein
LDRRLESQRSADRITMSDGPFGRLKLQHFSLERRQKDLPARRGRRQRPRDGDPIR